MSYGQLVLLTNSFQVNSYFFSGQLVLSSTCTLKSTLLLVKYYHLFNVNTNFEDIFSLYLAQKRRFSINYSIFCKLTSLRLYKGLLTNTCKYHLKFHKKSISLSFSLAYVKCFLFTSCQLQDFRFFRRLLKYFAVCNGHLT